MKLLVLPGDGIGPEITQATIAVLEAADRRFRLHLSFEQHDIGFAALEKHGTTLLRSTRCSPTRRSAPPISAARSARALSARQSRPGLDWAEAAVLWRGAPASHHERFFLSLFTSAQVGVQTSFPGTTIIVSGL